MITFIKKELSLQHQTKTNNNIKLNIMKTLNKLTSLQLNRIGAVIFLTIHLPLIISLVIAVIEQVELNNL